MTAPDLSPAERAVVDRFETAPDPYAAEPQWLVAYAPCGCVRAIRALGYERTGEDEFRREYPGCVPAADWPQVKCGTHVEVIA